MIRRARFFFLCLTVAVVVCGCATVIELDSDPSGATVYLVPQSDLTLDPSIRVSAEKLARYRVPEGVTPVKVRAQQKVYVIIFEYEGRRAEVRLDALPRLPNSARVRIP